MTVLTPVSTNHFVWIHTPKTGGTWLYRVFRDCRPPSWGLPEYPSPAHVQAREVESLLKRDGLDDRVQLPWLAGVRNPWDWYVSLYFFMEQQLGGGAGMFADPREERVVGAQLWEDRFSRGNSVQGFRAALPDLLRAFYEEKDYALIAPQQNFLQIDGKLVVRPIRFERLREEVVDALEETGAEIPSRLRHFVLNRKPVSVDELRDLNVSDHREYPLFYTTELQKLVYRHEQWVADTFGYRFGA